MDKDKILLWLMIILIVSFSIGLIIGAKIQGGTDSKLIIQLEKQVQQLIIVQKTDVKAIEIENVKDDLRSLEMKVAILGARDPLEAKEP